MASPYTMTDYLTLRSLPADIIFECVAGQEPRVWNLLVRAAPWLSREEGYKTARSAALVKWLDASKDELKYFTISGLIHSISLDDPACFCRILANNGRTPVAVEIYANYGRLMPRGEQPSLIMIDETGMNMRFYYGQSGGLRVVSVTSGAVVMRITLADGRLVGLAASRTSKCWYGGRELVDDSIGGMVYGCLDTIERVIRTSLDSSETISKLLIWLWALMQNIYLKCICHLNE